MKTNEIKYSKRMFAFLDILGFEKVVNESRSNPELIGKIANMLKRSKEIAQSALKSKLKVLEVNPNQYSHRSFSDMSVISGPYMSHDDMNFLSMWMMFNQYYMWKENRIFIRGAIVYGDIYEDEDIIFGPALIDAYHLERYKAVWPRVLIDKSLLAKNTKAERERDLLEFLRQDDDKLVYLDYLRELFHLFIVAEKEMTGTSKKGFSVPIKLFKDHREVILAQVSNTLPGKKQDETDDILGKYEELTKYHNSTINRLRQVIKDLMNNKELIREFFDDQIKSLQARRLGLTYEPKYSAEEHPEQADMLNILGAVINRITKRHPQDIFQIRDIVIIGQTELDRFERALRTFSSESPQELLKLDKELQELMIDIDSLGLTRKKV